MQPLGQQKTDDVEILVMMRGQPARVLLGFDLRVSAAQRLRRIDVVFWGEPRSGIGPDCGTTV